MDSAFLLSGPRLHYITWHLSAPHRCVFVFAFLMAIPRRQWRHRCVVTLGKFLLSRILGRGCDEALLFSEKKGGFQWKGGRQFRRKGGFGKDFYRKGNSVKRFGPFTEPPGLWKLKSCCPHPLPENRKHTFVRVQMEYGFDCFQVWFPNLLFLAFLDFLAFSFSRKHLTILSVFPFILKDFGGSASIRNPCLFCGFLAKRRSGFGLVVSAVGLVASTVSLSS